MFLTGISDREGGALCEWQTLLTASSACEVSVSNAWEPFTEKWGSFTLLILFVAPKIIQFFLLLLVSVQ